MTEQDEFPANPLYTYLEIIKRQELSNDQLFTGWNLTYPNSSKESRRNTDNEFIFLFLRSINAMYKKRPQKRPLDEASARNIVDNAFNNNYYKSTDKIKIVSKPSEVAAERAYTILGHLNNYLRDKADDDLSKEEQVLREITKNCQPVITMFLDNRNNPY